MKRVIGYTAALCLLALAVGCGGAASTGTLAYISNSSGAAGTGFTVYNVNTDGTLTLSSISPQSTAQPPKVLQFSANGRWAYFLDANGANVWGYARAGNGTLPTQITNSPFPVNGASAMVVAPNSNFLYVALPNAVNGQVKGELVVFEIDPATGTLSTVGSALPLGYQISQLAISSDGNSLYGLAPTQQAVVTFSLNASGGITRQGTFPVGQNPATNGMILSANGSYMYVLDTTFTGTNGLGATSPGFFAFNVSGYNLTYMTGQPFFENANAITGIAPSMPIAGATSQDSRFLFIANQGTHNISVFKIVPTSGTNGVAGEPIEVPGSTTTVNSIATSTASPFDCGCTTPSFVAVANANNAMYVLDTAAGRVYQFRVNQNTGQLRPLNPAFVGAASQSPSSNPTWITIR